METPQLLLPSEPELLTGLFIDIMSKEYFVKLQDPRWQRKRLEILDGAGWKCEDCGDSTSELQVHHCVYLKGVEPWDYSAVTLMSLCHVCHKKRQAIEQMTVALFAKFLRFQTIDEVYAIASSLGEWHGKNPRRSNGTGYTFGVSWEDAFSHPPSSIVTFKDPEDEQVKAAEVGL